MKKRICGFSIYDVRTGGEDLTLSGDYSWRDTGELVKKNQKGAYTYDKEAMMTDGVFEKYATQPSRRVLRITKLKEKKNERNDD